MIYGSKMSLPPPRYVTDEIKPLEHDLYLLENETAFFTEIESSIERLG